MTPKAPISAHGAKEILARPPIAFTSCLLALGMKIAWQRRGQSRGGWPVQDPWPKVSSLWTVMERLLGKRPQVIPSRPTAEFSGRELTCQHAGAAAVNGAQHGRARGHALYGSRPAATIC